MANNNVEYKIKLLDEFGKPLDNLQKKVGDFGKAQQKMNGDLNKSLTELRAQLARYKQASENSYRTEHIKKYKGLIAETEKQISELEKTTKTCADKTEGFANKFKSLTGVSLGWAAVGAAAMKAGQFAFDFGKQGVEADAQMQKYNVTLKTMLGSTGAARDRMQEYMDLARKTPFELTEVVEAGNKLQSLGAYSRENLTMLGDLAAASGKPMEQVMTAYSQLATGQKGDASRMFRDLLITADDWQKATGKGVSKNGELLATTKEMIAVLPQIMKSKGYLGMMAAQSETTGGKMANLEDSIFGLKAAIGEHLRPATNEYLKVASGVIEKLTNWVEIPVEQKIANEKTELNLLTQQLIENYDKEDKRQTLIDEINRKYPEFLKNVNLEKDGLEGIKNELVKVNEEYDKKIQKAFYQSRYDALMDEYKDVKSEYDANELRGLARQRMLDAEQKVKKIARDAGANDVGDYSVDKDGNIEVSGESGGEYRTYTLRNLKLTYEQKKQLIILGNEISSAYAFGGGFGKNDNKQAKLSSKAQELKIKMDFLIPMLEPETATATTATTTNLTSTNDIDAAANSISAGGKSVKNFNIVINDGLIKQVDNHFASTNESPQTAGDFMWQLSQALQMILNDVNYSAAA